VRRQLTRAAPLHRIQLYSSRLHPSPVLDWFASIRQALTGPLQKNRRREHRKPYKVSIEIRTRDGGIYAGVSREVSPLGMGAIASAPLQVGDEVLIKYSHPVEGQAARAVVRRATVRQRLGYRYGFEFQLPLDV
jgi:hypothetical protein